MKKLSTRLLSVLLVVLMLMSLAPVAALADDLVPEEAQSTDQLPEAVSTSNAATGAGTTVIGKKESTLSEGVTQTKYEVYDKNGARVEYFVGVTDLKVSTNKVCVSYKDMDCTNYGLSTLRNQVESAEKIHEDEDYSVVLGINASYFVMEGANAGAPIGAFAMNGTIKQEASNYSGYKFFAILDDGTPYIGYSNEWAEIRDRVVEAVGGPDMLVDDGAPLDFDDQAKYPRAAVGITADNKVVFMLADGSNAPTSVGFTLKEEAQIMADLGCVRAIRLDEGGSATYGCRPEGQKDFDIINNPSDHTERAISAGLIVVSTAPASDTFARASLSANDLYVTPGSSTEISAVGVSPAGTSAEIPENAVYSATLGTMNGNVFTAGEETGDAVVSMIVDDKTVGSVTIHVVEPTSIAFNNTTVTVPYGKTVAFDISVKYGVNDVKYRPSDFTFEFENTAIGSVQKDTFNFTATSDETIKESKVSAQYKDLLSADATVKLGRGSKVIFDFEDSSQQDLFSYTCFPNTAMATSEAKIVNATNGKVHSGEQSLALTCDFTQMITYNDWPAVVMRFKEKVNADDPYNLKDYNLAGATAFGFWMYIPDGMDVTSVHPRVLVDWSNDGVTWTKGNRITTWPNLIDYREGWHYFSIDLSQFADKKYIKINSETPNFIEFYVSDGDWKNKGIIGYSKMTFYLDDFTIDYSSAVDDREAPVFSSFKYGAAGLSDSTVLNDNAVLTVNSDYDFSVSVADNTKKDNFTGLDKVNAYVDGNAVKCTLSNGVASISGVKLNDGTHKVKFVAFDKIGNSDYAERTFIVSAGTDMTKVTLVPHDTTIEKVLSGSLYYMDLKVSDIQSVEKLTTTLKVINTNDWEPRGIELAKGFKGEYSVNSITGDLTMTITKSGDVDATGEAVIASVPIRAWYEHDPVGYTNLTGTRYLYAKDIQITCKQGTIETKDETIPFSVADYQICTEVMPAAGNVGGSLAWHKHSNLKTLEKAATCTEDGYTGRTFCEGCNSIVDFGTTVPATGHKFELVDGVLKCTNDNCGEVFTGVWEDGKEYVDGIRVSDGWNGNSYYLDGQKLTGVHKLNAPDDSGEFWYDFGTTGVTTGKFSGMFYNDELGAYVYSKIGVLTGGWQQVDGEWHYFNTKTLLAVSGKNTINGVTYQFDETGMTKGAWKTDENGTRFYYGPSYYTARRVGYITMVEIDGYTYNFDRDGYITYGTLALQDAASPYVYLFKFDDEGKLVEEYTDEGFYTVDDGSTYYVNKDGYVLRDTGLNEYDGNYYFVLFSGKVQKSGYSTVTESNNNGIKIDGENPANGTYYFGADGKMLVTGIDPSNRYRENGLVCKGKGLVKIGDDYYCVKSNGEIFMNTTYVVTEAKTNSLLPAGKYTFGPDGKMVVEPDGINADGYIVINGVIQANKGLVKIGNDYYFALYSGKARVNGYSTVTESNNNGIKIDGENPANGTYYFGADGKMLVTGIDPSNRYRENGLVCKGKGLVKIGDDYYCVKSNGEIFMNTTYVVTEAKTNSLLPAGKYTFGPNGKLVVEPDGVNADGYIVINGAIQANKGLVKIGNDYYFALYSGKARVNGYSTVTESNNNGIKIDGENPANGTYYFGADGKMLVTGIDPSNRYRENGLVCKGKGLVKIGDDYYCVKSNGEIFMNTTYVVTEAKTNSLLPAGKYTFGPDGKLIPDLQND